MSIAGPKKPRGRPRVDSEPVKLRLQREILDALDAFMARHPGVTTRQAAIVSLMESALIAEGILTEDTARAFAHIFRDQKKLTDREFAAMLARAAKRRGSSEPEPDPPSDPTQPPLRPPKPPMKG
jgi:hypothetical protein